MNEKELNKELNQKDDKVQVYENDDAYLFEEEVSGDGSLEVGYKANLNENNNKIINQKELLNKFKTNMSQDEKTNEEINEDNNVNNNNNINIKNENIINNNINNINNSFKDKKYMINDINSDLENEENVENEEEENQENENLSFGEHINENENENENEKINDNYAVDNTKINNKLNINNNLEDKNFINEKENNINNNNDNDNQLQNQNQNEEYDENESDSGVPLVTLNFLSICQCCKNSFNSKENIPYLFKCGHFFCKQCIIEQFTDEEGIKCPNDGLIANSISDLKILNNFITDKTVTQRTSSPFSSPDGQDEKNKKTTKIKNKINNENTQNYPYKCCEFHKGQKLTHFIEETKELICVYCAFERFKQNQGIEIKEINDKCHDMESDMDSIIEENQYNVGIIQTSLKEIKKNKENEEKKINEIFDRFIEMIKTKKDEYLSKIDNLFTNNAEKLSQKLELFSNKIEKSESVKEKINIFLNSQDSSQFIQLYEYYNKLINELQSVHSLKLNLQKYKFCYEDEMAISRMISKFGEIKLTPKIFTFIGNSNKEEHDIINENNNNYTDMKKLEEIKVKLNNNIINYNNKMNMNMNINEDNNNINCDNTFQNYNNITNDNIRNPDNINLKNKSSSNFYKKNINTTYQIDNYNTKNNINNNNKNKYMGYSNNFVDNTNYMTKNIYSNKNYNNNIINYDKYSIPKTINNDILNKARNSSLNGGIRVNTPNSLNKMYNNYMNNNNNNNNNLKNKINDNSLNKKVNKYKINLTQIKNNRNTKINNKKNSLQFKYNNNNNKFDTYKNKSYSFISK